MASLPSPVQLARLARAQAEAIAALPGAMLSLTRAVSSLDQTMREARAAVARLQRIGERLEGILDEVEEPVRDLAPGLRRMGEVLDDPVVSEIPDTVRRIRDDVLPLVATLRGTSDMLDRFSGRGLLSGRRRPEPATPATPPAPPIPAAPIPAAPPAPPEPPHSLPAGVPDEA
jgi:ABC-type transporter Mla subunit MlaD